LRRPRLIDVAEDLLDGPVNPSCPEGVLYFAEAGWHNDDGIGVRGVKFAIYFDHLVAESGALRFLPGSHHPEQHARLVAYREAQMPIDTDAKATGYLASIPGYVAETRPGDVIAFDLHTWHASIGGRDRLAWTIEYQRCPESDAERERTKQSMHDGFEKAFLGFDRERFPIWRGLACRRRVPSAARRGHRPHAGRRRARAPRRGSRLVNDEPCMSFESRSTGEIDILVHLGLERPEC